MTKDDVIGMADKAGIEIVLGDGWPYERLIKKLHAFAKLAAAAEREACAKIAEAYPKYGESTAEEIRARSTL